MMMTPSLKHIFDRIDIFSDFESKLQNAYVQMDKKYKAAAEQYPFQCNGCEDNCCRTQFYHHTLLEFLYIRKGFQALDVDICSQVMQQAHSVNHRHMKATDRGALAREMCPLNINNVCILYDYRPMICRLHGIPYEFHQPGRSIFRGPGCHEFDLQCAGKPYVTFDRTSSYRVMAELENNLRSAFEFKQKIKLSIAEMILTLASGKT